MLSLFPIYSLATYNSWRQAMNKLILVNGSIPKPSSSDSQFSVWQQANHMVLSRLLNSLHCDLAASSMQILHLSFGRISMISSSQVPTHISYLFNDLLLPHFSVMLILLTLFPLSFPFFNISSKSFTRVQQFAFKDLHMDLSSAFGSLLDVCLFSTSDTSSLCWFIISLWRSPRGGSIKFCFETLNGQTHYGKTHCKFVGVLVDKDENEKIVMILAWDF